jgi:hypothetical protein
MSVLPPKADIADNRRHVGLVPSTDIAGLFNHLFGAGEERRRNVETEAAVQPGVRQGCE